MARFRTVAGFFPWVAAHAVFGTPHRENATFGLSILRRHVRVVLREKGDSSKGNVKTSCPRSKRRRINARPFQAPDAAQIAQSSTAR